MPGSSGSWISFAVIVVVLVGVYLGLYFSGRRRGSGSSSSPSGGQGGDQGGGRGDGPIDRLGPGGQGVNSVRQPLSSEQATSLRALLEAIIQDSISRSLPRTQTDHNQVLNSDVYVIDIGPHDEVTNGSIIGTLQKKPRQPRNPLIEKAVAFDKSKVERMEPLVEAKEEAGEFQLKQSQLRKVRERVNAPVQQNAEEECSLKQLQLRKVGERANSAAEPKVVEKEFLPEQLQLRKVTDDIINVTLQTKFRQPRNPLIDEVVAFDKNKLRKAERMEPPVEAKEEAREFQLKRSQLRKVRERVNAPVEQTTEKKCSLKHLQLRKVGEKVNSAAESKFEEKRFLPEQLQLRKVIDGIINGTLQTKSQQPRNPLIDEVVGFDKSKLRKVERTKPPVETKEEEGAEYRLKRLQLRKVGEMEKAPVKQNAEEDFSHKHLQLRKVGERVNLAVEPKFEKGFLPEQLQLRKLKTKLEAELKVDETGSPLVQLRKVRERVDFKSKAEETELPRLQLRKVGERAQTLVEEKGEERDSLFEQIRIKKYSLKPAVSATPNFQGPITNSKVAAILEKARSIRQAMAGSDEDENRDRWSDS